MRKIIINGPCKLNGTVQIQGAKNAAIRHLLIPLLTNDKFVFKNIPNIGTSHKMLEIVKLQGGQVKWTSKNTVEVNTKNVKISKTIPADIFFNTSGGIVAIPILASRFGQCKIEKEGERKDYGGDQIGSRKMEAVIKTLKCIGIDFKETKDYLIFNKVSNKPFFYEIPVYSYAASVMAVFCALFNKGISQITKYTSEVEFFDVLELLKKAGAEIDITKEKIKIHGERNIKGVNYTNMSDRHDFATFLSAALSTDSKITLTNLDYEKMKLDALNDVVKQMNIRLKFKNNSCFINSDLSKLKPVKIIAGRYPNFQTEWQVLFSPLLTQVKGKSKVVDTIFTKRMGHWEELKKMGAKFQYFKVKEYPEEGNKPRAVKVFGHINLKGAKVTAKDVRSGAALVIAALTAKGKTEITGIEHIERGYEDIVGRFRKLGADIKLTADS